MASLALLVSMIFLVVIILGPLSMTLHRLGLRTIAAVVAVLAVLIGGYWTMAAPFPISIVGGISDFMGLMTVNYPPAKAKCELRHGLTVLSKTYKLK